VVLALAACNLGTNLDDIPTTARVRVAGAAPDEIKLIVSTDFFEQLNLETLERRAVLQTSDTLTLTLPYDQTWDLTELASVYVELLYEPTSTASVTMRVNLDNGESYEQAATMSTGAQLIYYWIWSGQIG
jgi:hypothetical protein